MKAMLTLALLFATVFSGFSEEPQELKIIRENATVFVSDGIHRAEIDSTTLIAKYKNGMEEMSFTNKITRLYKNIVSITVPQGVKVEDFMDSLLKSGDFETVEYNFLGTLLMSPNDTHSSDQWYLNTINAYSVWDINTGTPSVKAAVIDSGVYAGHSDLYSLVDSLSNISQWEGYDFANGCIYTMPSIKHGTMVAGIIGARTNNNYGIAGLSGGNNSSGVKIIPYNVGSGNLTVTVANTITAISYAITKGVDVINLSLGWSPDFVPYYSTFSDVLDEAYLAGIVIICAAGNFPSSPDYKVMFPASHSKTIAVGAIDRSIGRADFSCYGSGLDLVAPGVDIKSLGFYFNNSNGSVTETFEVMDGTSFSAPQVSGVAALMKSVNPYLTPQEIKSILISTCTKPSGYSYTNGWNNEVGYGILNAYRAVNIAGPHGLTGPYCISTSGTYSIDYLPPECIVTWSLSDNKYNQNCAYYNSNCIQQNTPAANQCTLTYAQGHNLYNVSLTATVTLHGRVLRTLTKEICLNNGFVGEYYDGTSSYLLNYPMPLYMRPNHYIEITSPNFDGATFTRSGDAVVSYWNYDPSRNKLTIGISASAGNNLIVAVHCTDGNTYTLPIIRSSYPHNISIQNIDNHLNVVVASDIECQDNQTLGIIGSNQEGEWSMEIYDAITMESVYNGKFSDRKVDIDVSRFSKGVYLIRVVINGEAITRKIMLGR